MPPQQGYRLLDFVDNILDFRAHEAVIPFEFAESARNIGACSAGVKV